MIIPCVLEKLHVYGKVNADFEVNIIVRKCRLVSRRNYIYSILKFRQNIIFIIQENYPLIIVKCGTMVKAKYHADLAVGEKNN